MMKAPTNPQNTSKQVGKKAAIQIFSCVCLLSFDLAQVQAQTCKPNISTNTPDSRFEVLASGKEVKDKQTGLVWQRCSLGQTWSGSTCIGAATSHDWQDALAKAQQVGTGYRLPNIKELISIMALNCYDPMINQSIFPNTSSNGYWSSSLSAGDPNNTGHAWQIFFNNGEAHWSNKNDTLRVRAVRSE